MKTKWKRFIFVILSLSFFSCAHRPSESLRPNQKSVHEKIKTHWQHQGYQYQADDESNFEFLHSTRMKVTYKILQFANSQEAVEHLMNRRLTVQRLYQLSSEPYFGTPDESSCRQNISVDEPVEQSRQQVKASLRLLANLNYVLGDCLLQNNVFRVNMILLTYDELFIEAKVYVPIAEKNQLWPFVGL